MDTATSTALLEELDTLSHFDARPAAAHARAFAQKNLQVLRADHDENSLRELLKHPGIWRRSSSAQQQTRALPTGLATLDAQLPGGGWPLGALSEILFDHDGIGELDLLMPALAELTQRRQRVVFVTPPYIPYAPALDAHGLDLRYVVQIDSAPTEGSWSAEQCLRSGSCGAVLSWMQQGDYTQLRRLQLAAESGDALAFLFRPARAADKPSPAALRLHLHSSADQVDIEILKCRGNFDTRRARLR
jgi:hypothetical protein